MVNANFNTKIPFPPTVNHMFHRTSRRVIKTKKTKAWFDAAILMIRTTPGYRKHKYTGRLGITIWLVPPTARKYDVDNRVKAVLDAIQQSGLITDDSQFYELMVRKHDKQPEGKTAAACYFTIKTLADDAGVVLEL